MLRLLVMRRLFVSLLVLIASAPGVSAQVPRGADGPPNIVLILADDLGWGDLSSYGAPDLETPHIDGLVEAGMRFDRFYASSPVCSPTRAALLTGRYPSLVGVPGVVRTHADDSWGWLDPEALLLPALLKQRGYHTALVGKWHLGLTSPNRPEDRGFDHVHGFLGDMMDDYYTHRRHGLNYMVHGAETIDPEGHATDLFSDWAAEYVRSRADEPGPFFLYLAYNAPHTPIQPPDEWLARVRARAPGRDERRARLVALIEHLDAGIGQVLEALRETGQAARTLVVFTSDNGGQTDVGARNGPYRDGKQSVYEGGLLVPTAAVWPGRVAPGTASTRVLTSMDLFPTLLAAAGLEPLQAVDGVSFLPTLLGRAVAPPERTLVFERREGNLRYNGLTIHAVREGPWKLVHNSPYEPFELYDLATDPYETTDVIDVHPDVYRRLAGALRAHLRRGGAVPWAPPEATQH